jgi:peptide/nickel transport system permease protein
MGRDMLSTMLYGMRVSIMIGMGAVFLQALLGIGLGLVAGYHPAPGRYSDAGCRCAALIFHLHDGDFFRRHFSNAVFGMWAMYEEIAIPLLILIIGIAEWPQYARTVRASVLA